MNITVFNLAILAGWLLVLVGVCLINLGAGLAVGGLLLIAITLLVARIAGILPIDAGEKDPV